MCRHTHTHTQHSTAQHSMRTVCVRLAVVDGHRRLNEIEGGEGERDSAQSTGGRRADNLGLGWENNAAGGCEVINAMVSLPKQKTTRDTHSHTCPISSRQPLARTLSCPRQPNSLANTHTPPPFAGFQKTRNNRHHLIANTKRSTQRQVHDGNNRQHDTAPMSSWRQPRSE